MYFENFHKNKKLDLEIWSVRGLIEKKPNACLVTNDKVGRRVSRGCNSVQKWNENCYSC